MLPESIKYLTRRVPLSNARVMAALLGCLVAMAIPLLALIGGHFTQALVGHPHQPFIFGLPILGRGLAELSPLARISWLLGLAAVISLTSSLLLLWMYRLIQQAAVDFEVGMFEVFRRQIQRLAQVRTLTAQQSDLLDILEYHLPRVRGVLARFWQAVPRHLVQMLICMVIAGMIHARFAALAVIASVLVALLYQLFERSRRRHVPVVRENATRLRSRLVRISLRGPLLHTVHDPKDIEHRIRHLLALYRRDAIRSLISSSWRIPLIVICMSLVTSLLIFVMSVEWLRRDLQAPSVTALMICLAGTAFSARRLWQTYREIKLVEPASEELSRFLSIAVPETDDSRLGEIRKVERLAELEHVTVQDTLGQKLLEDISLSFETGQLIGIVGSHGVEARTLGELLVGFGRPTSGRMLMDGHLVTDLKSDALARCSHWVASDGGLLTGTLAENLASGNSRTIEKAIHQAGLAGLVLRLSEGIHTLITYDDDRLVGDDAFRIGIARALQCDASICVIEEPEHEVDGDTEQQTLEVIRQLVRPSHFSFVLPQRLTTLRSCHRVVFVHEHRLMDSGTHAELLQRNELYRHLTYLRFNPFR